MENNIQSVFLTSDPMNLESNGINSKNGLLEKLKNLLHPKCKALFICSNPDTYEVTDKYGNILYHCFIRSGFDFADFKILDARNEEKASELVSDAGFILLMGGHVPTQNEFFKRIKLKQLLQKANSTVLGLSAGSMNMAEVVYAQPELEGEAISKEYRRFLPGLGMTKTMIIPHYQKIKNECLDGMRIFEDITYPDSVGREFVALSDGSYIEICEHKERVCGESYLIKDGDITKLCEDDESKQLY